MNGENSKREYKYVSEWTEVNKFVSEMIEQIFNEIDEDVEFPFISFREIECLDRFEQHFDEEYGQEGIEFSSELLEQQARDRLHLSNLQDKLMELRRFTTNVEVCPFCRKSNIEECDGLPDEPKQYYCPNCKIQYELETRMIFKITKVSDVER